MITFTNYKYRIRSLNKDEGLSWLFLPGGPGIGSEYLEDFVTKLSLKGSKLLIDFPADGSNKQGNLDISEWERGLIDLVQSISSPILVAHSFAGMFILTIPELEKHIKGLVLINSPTKSTFFEYTTKTKEKYNLPDLSKAFEKYNATPSNSSYKDFWNLYKFYCFTKEEIPDSNRILDKFCYNHASYDYISKKFYINYNSKYSPTKILTLTIASEEDYILDSIVYIRDKLYNKPNIINKIIANAGHFPWLKHLEEIQGYFDEFSILIK